ncbi:hypothetical protein C8R44DRAFT_603459 [Mycena epipterygia]|nr:hypothetical protein C8R44DRAFT_603459 [Mycena epipterygia]
MFNAHDNDAAYMSTRRLLRQMRDQGSVPTYLVRVTHKTSGMVHVIAIFPDGRYICDCCVGKNLGIVYSHFFLAWTKMDGLPFHVSLIRARWYQDPGANVKDIPAVTFQGKHLPNTSISNPFSAASNASQTAPAKTVRSTQTIPQCEVYHSIQAEIRPLMNGIQTQEQLERLQKAIAQIQYVS